MPNSNLSKDKIIEKAGVLAACYKRMGFHCSESMVRAIPEALGLTVDADVIRSACGFFGGGGGTGGRCGIIEVGIMLISLLYGRMHPLQSEQAARTLVSTLIDRFEKEFGSTLCSEIKPAAIQKFGPVIGCEENYIKGASLVTRLLLEADDILK